MDNQPNKYGLSERVFYIFVNSDGKWVVDKDKDYITGIKFRKGDAGEIIYHLFETDTEVSANDIFLTLAIAQYACDARNFYKFRKDE